MQQDPKNIPIDIHVNRLLDWLISRKHCDKDWPSKIATVREKINEAIKDMPENPTITKILLGASPCNYFHCVRIVEVLKQTEGEKNLFGSYTSSRIKEWDEILKMYLKSNLYLAESALLLSRTVTYELPALRRSVTKLESASAEAEKKHLSGMKGSKEAKEKFLSACSALHLPPLEDEGTLGNGIIREAASALPPIFSNIEMGLRKLTEVESTYSLFTGIDDPIPILRFIIQKGNVTVWEWTHGEPPLSIERPKPIEEIVSEVGGIDWGDEDGGKIDWGGDGDVQEERVEIDWGDVPAESSSIDWGIGVDDVDTSGIAIEDDGTQGGVASGNDALFILENPSTRTQLLDELYELQGFISQRLTESEMETGHDVSLGREEVGPETLRSYLSQLTNVISLFEEKKTKDLLHAAESQRFVARMARNLILDAKLSKKLEGISNEAASTQQRLLEEANNLRPQINILMKQCRELQASLGKEISSKYNSRPTYITGGIS